MSIENSMKVPLLTQSTAFNQEDESYEQIFNNIHSYFESEVTKTIKISKTFKLQLFAHNTQFVACSPDKIFCVEIKNPKNPLNITLKPTIISIALSEDEQFLFVALADNTISAFSVPELVFISSVETEQIKNLRTISDNGLVGHGDLYLMRWEWINNSLVERKKLRLENPWLLYGSEYILSLSEYEYEVIDYNGNQLVYNETEFSIKQAAISRSNTFIAVLQTDEKAGLLSIFNIRDGSYNGSIELAQNDLNGLILIKFAPSEYDILCGYQTGAYRMLNLRKVSQKVSISQKPTHIKYMTMDLMTRFIVTCGATKIYITPFTPKSKRRITFTETISNVKEVHGKKEFFLLKKNLETSQVTLSEYDFQTLRENVRTIFRTDVLCAEYYEPQSEYIIAFQIENECFVCRLDSNNLISNNQLRFPKAQESILEMVLSTKYLFLYYEDQLSVHSAESFAFIATQKSDAPLSAFYFVQSINALAYGHMTLETLQGQGKNYKSINIRFWNPSIIAYEESVKTMKTVHKYPISCITTSERFKYLITGDDSGVISLCNPRSEKLIVQFKLHTAKISTLYLYNNFLFAYSVDTQLSCWDMKIKMLTVSSKGRTSSSLLITKDAGSFIHNGERELELIDNLMKQKQITVVGVTEPKRFMKYIKKLYPKEDKLEFDPSFERGVIFPYRLTPMHFFAYLNHTKYLHMSLESGSNISNSSFGENPLTLAAKQQFKDCIRIMIKHLANTEALSKNPYMLRVINNNTIMTLNSIKIKKLEVLYEAFIRESTNPRLPNFISKKTPTPIYFQSNEVEINTEAIQSTDIRQNRGEEVKFYETLIKLNLNIGSGDSYRFLRSLTITPNQEILTCEYVNHVLAYKWKKLRPLIVGQAVLYWACLLLWIIYMIYFYEGNAPMNAEYFLTMPFVINLLLYTVEICQIIVDLPSYIRNFRNWIDQCRGLLCGYYILNVWMGSIHEYDQLVLMTILFISLIRSISYFCIFTQTRYLIHLINTVIWEIRAFFILFMYTTVASALLLYGLQENRGGFEGLFMAFVHSYMLNLGEFSTDNYNIYEWFVFYFATLINFILMLNLLISIMADIYDKVKLTKLRADNIERAEMLLEIESLFFFYWNLKKPKYFQVCAKRSFDLENNFNEKVIRMIENNKRYIKNIDSRFAGIEDQHNQRFDALDQQIKEIKQILTNPTGD